MDKETIKQKINDSIEYVIGAEPEELTPEANFNRDLGADELDMVEIAMKIEKELSCNIPDYRLEQVNTVSELHGLVFEVLNISETIPQTNAMRDNYSRVEVLSIINAILCEEDELLEVVEYHKNTLEDAEEFLSRAEKTLKLI